MGLTESFGAPIARRLGWARTFVSLTFVATLLGLGLANIALRATWHEVEDGVLWVTGPQGVTAAEVAPDSAAAQAGVRPGDVLLAIGDRPGRAALGSAGLRAFAIGRHPSSLHGAAAAVDRGGQPRAGAVASWDDGPVLRARRRWASSRCWSARVSATGVTATKPRCTSSGCAWHFSAPSPSRSTGGSIDSTGSSTGPTSSRFCCCRRCSCISRWSFPNARAAGSARRWGARSCRCSICRRRCSVWPASSPSRARRWTRSTSSAWSRRSIASSRSTCRSAWPLAW